MASYVPLLQEYLATSHNKPVHLKIKSMEDILRTTSLKDLKTSFPLIIHEIFDFEKELNQGWQLDKISKHHNPELFTSIRSLLSPVGPMMKVVNYLHADPSALYEFPLKCIPAPSRRMIESGAVPAFYANKLQVQNFSSAVIMLNAFEYFMFHLAYALVNPLWRSINFSWNDLHDYIYPILIQDMLSHFLPCDKSSLPSVPQFSGTSVRPILAQNHGRPYGKSMTQLSSSHSGLTIGSHKSLFKSSFLNAQKQHMQSLPVYDQAETEIWRSETFLQILAEFWLNQNASNAIDAQSFSLGISLSALYYRDPFKSMFEQFMPTMNHIKMVRLLVKYMHYFTNSTTAVFNSPYTQTVHSPLDQFKRSAIPHIIQKKLYTFLRHAFSMWPLDSCFRMVLETWLSYIQPWRYKDITKDSMMERRNWETDSNKFIDNRWESFVEENLLFYTVLTAEFIPRVFRMDLTSPYSAYMVFRVSKILSLPNLTNLIYKAESDLLGNITHHTDLGGSYLSGHNFLVSSILPSQMLDLEGPNFQYESFFSEAMKHNMNKVINQLSQALEFIRSQQAKAMLSTNKVKNSSGFFSFLVGSSKSQLDLYNSPEYRRLSSHLEQSIINFCDVFSIIRPVCQKDPFPDSQMDMSMSSESLYLAESEKQHPECVQTEQGLQLTDTGRKQLINKERKFDIFYLGDPDLQPVRSFENGMLVRLLYHFCSFINYYFRSELISLYNSQNFSGYFSRVFLRPPSSPEDLQRQIHSPISKQAAHLTRSHQPRVSLRFLASYHTLVQIALLYLFLSFVLSVGPVLFVFIILAMTTIYGLLVASFRFFTKSETIPRMSKID